MSAMNPCIIGSRSSALNMPPQSENEEGQCPRTGTKKKKQDGSIEAAKEAD